MRFPKFKKFSLLKRVPIRESNATHPYSDKNKETRRGSKISYTPLRESNCSYLNP